MLSYSDAMQRKLVVYFYANQIDLHVSCFLQRLVLKWRQYKARTFDPKAHFLTLVFLLLSYMTDSLWCNKRKVSLTIEGTSNFLNHWCCVAGGFFCPRVQGRERRNREGISF